MEVIPVHAYAHDDVEPAATDAALARAEELVSAAAQRLRDQDEQLESLHRLVECLVELGPPVTVVEGSVVRAWSDALEQVTGVRRATALGARLRRVLPSLEPTQEGCRWTASDGAQWAVDARSVGPELEVLCWTRPVGVVEEPRSVPA
jgi:hypothetical protein